ncbi:MAG: hypothetical protein JOZ48_05650 [Acidobacteriaceae bacterium]|nr:hypothetical protein [Acidobacteriaceae bacterium]
MGRVRTALSPILDEVVDAIAWRAWRKQILYGDLQHFRQIEQHFVSTFDRRAPIFETPLRLMSHPASWSLFARSDCDQPNE